MFHDDILKRYDSLIIDIVEEQYISTESGVTSYNAKLKLKGNSSLRIREIWERNNLVKYSYYWLNSEKMKIACVVGARPNFMKIAPILAAMKKYPQLQPLLVHTGQHYE